MGVRGVSISLSQIFRHTAFRLVTERPPDYNFPMSARLANALWWHITRTEQLDELRERERILRRGKKLRRLKRYPAQKLIEGLRNRVAAAVRAVGAKKSAKTAELIGCTVPELRAWLEKQFTEGMSWENYGKWHVDHKRPCCWCGARVPKVVAALDPSLSGSDGFTWEISPHPARFVLENNQWVRVQPLYVPANPFTTGSVVVQPIGWWADRT